MANVHMKRRSVPPVIKELQIKITLKCHIAPTRIAKIQKYDNTKYWQRDRETKALTH